MRDPPTTRASRSIRTLRRITLGAVVGVFLLLVVTLIAGQVLKSRLRNSHPPPGLLVDVGGHRLHIDCTGEGGPTVVLASGLDDFSVFWALVQPDVAKFARVCAFDRAGLGWSEPSPEPPTIGTMVADLHELLTKAGFTGPLVLVGHSFGGPQVELYASLYPEQVTGLVLVDAAPADLFQRLPTWPGLIAEKVRLYRTLATLESLGLLAFTPSSVPTRGLLQEAASAYRAIAVSTGYFRVAAAESEAFERNLDAVREAKIDLGSTPLVVISRGYWDPIPGLSATENDQAWNAWQSMQSELARLSTNSRTIVAARSEHHVQLQQPELVVDAIRVVLGQPQTGPSARPPEDGRTNVR